MLRNYIEPWPELDKRNRYNTIIIGIQAVDVYKTNSYVYLTECGDPHKVVAKFEIEFFDYLYDCKTQSLQLYSSAWYDRPASDVTLE